MTGHCFQIGTLKLGDKPTWNRGFDYSGALASFDFESPESMQQKALNYTTVIRPGGKKIKGSEYSLRMAINDWSKTQN